VYKVKNSKAFDEMPELGMGYHFGVVVPEGREKGEQGVIVLNGQYALTPEEVLDTRSFDRLLSDLGKEISPRIGVIIIQAPPLIPARTIVPNNDISLFKASFGPLIVNMGRYESRAVLHASPPFPLLTKSQENFVRFSAFQNDRRVLNDGSLLPGSYVTSKRDAAFGPSGFAVVGRYALPNILPATNWFDIKVPRGTAGLVGTVSPAFGQSGGGVEIELVKGAPKGSVTGRSTIPEY
jgi:hypothetical protein